MTQRVIFIMRGSAPVQTTESVLLETPIRKTDPVGGTGPVW
jgi:hypothetical protein